MDLDLFRKFQATGDIRIRNKLVMDNIRVVHYVARMIGVGPDYPDLIQAGIIGLIAGIERYAPEKGPFLPFVKWRVRYEIQEAIRRSRGTNYRVGSPDAERRTDAEVYDILGYTGYDYAPVSSTPKDPAVPRATLAVDPGLEARRVEARADLRRVLPRMPDADVDELLAYVDAPEEAPRKAPPKAPPLPRREAALLAMAQAEGAKHGPQG